MQDAVVIVLRDGPRVLAIRRGPGGSRSGFWCAPSGRIEPGESPADAVVREAREELGLEVRAIQEVWTCTTDDGRYRLRWWLARIVGGELTPDPLEVTEARWVTPDEYLALSPGFPAHDQFFTRILPTLDPHT